MTKANEIKEKLYQAHNDRMGVIYEKCDEKGIPHRYADSLYYRLTESPLKHTLNVVNAGDNKYSNKAGFSRLKSLLEIMLDVMPNHKKAEEWREAIKLLK